MGLDQRETKTLFHSAVGRSSFHLKLTWETMSVEWVRRWYMYMDMVRGNKELSGHFNWKEQPLAMQQLRRGPRERKEEEKMLKVLDWESGIPKDPASSVQGIICPSFKISEKDSMPYSTHFLAEHPWRKARGFPLCFRFHQGDLYLHTIPNFSRGPLLQRKPLTYFQLFQIALKIADPYTWILQSRVNRSDNARLLHCLAFLGRALAKLCLTRIFHGSSPKVALAIHLEERVIPWLLRSFSPNTPQALSLVHHSQEIAWCFLIPLPSVHRKFLMVF